MAAPSPSPVEIVEVVAIYAVPVIIAITLHEAAHGYVARFFGDDTAEKAGRISLNPLRHVDPIGTIILPGLLLLANTGFVFGYAKPVPVNFLHLRRPKQDMVWVAAAGPGMNVLLAAISTLLIYVPLALGLHLPRVLVAVLLISVRINLLLAVFNLIPIPPLDGGRVAVGLLPLPLARPLAQLSRFGIFFVLALFIILPRLGFDVFHWLVEIPVHFLEQPIFALLKGVLPAK
ncbi:MAG TPA: site-2 protease family protein [Rhizomicrobium sp.]|nr:site-2 protease family protein [Rhizomicrobium sp.]